jgi:NAD(P)-dependent dehydrogenase (short-subunit alcohol dehydrogenase family)
MSRSRRWSASMQRKETEGSPTRFDDSPVPDFLDRLLLEDQGFVVLGAGQGIGRQAAHALATAGARVLCVDLDSALADRVAEEIQGFPSAADVTVRADLQRVFEEAESQIGPLRGVIDVVGMAKWAPLLEMEEDIWDGQFDICLRHAYLTIQIAGRALREAGNGGAIAFVSSASGITGAARHAAYGAAKAALISLVKSAAVELAADRIRVNCVAPGIVETSRLARTLFQDSDYRRAQQANVPLGRLGTPADVAGALLFLASDLSSYITGQTVSIDGGVGSKFGFPVPDASA